jgi:hypothetical protein
MRRHSPTRIPCAACGVEIIRSTGLPLCRADAVLAHDAFERAHRGADPTTRQRAWFDFFGGRNAPAIEAARVARMAGV